jgi:hypothetical protein
MRVLLLALAAALLVVSGCARSSIYRVPVAGAPQAGDAEASQPLAVDISNLRGRVTIESGAWIKVPQVQARAYDASESAGLEHEWVSAEYITQAGVGTLRILTAQPAGRADVEPRFEIKVRAPNVQGLRIRTADGNVFVRGVRGAVDIKTTGEGDILVRSPHALTQPITLGVETGDIRLELSKDSTGAIEARAPRGEVVSQNPRGGVTNLQVTRDAWRVIYNAGTNPIVLTADEGDIDITLGAGE